MHSTTDRVEDQLIDEAAFLTRRLPGSSTDIELPGGWLLRHRARPADRSVLEVFNGRRDLVDLVASTARASVSIDAAWRGCTADPDSEPRCWSLAMGHVVDDADVFVTFLGRNPDGRLRQTTLAPIVVDDLWIAMVSFHRDVVALHQRTRHCLQRIVSHPAAANRRSAGGYSSIDTARKRDTSCPCELH